MGINKNVQLEETASYRITMPVADTTGGLHNVILTGKPNEETVKIAFANKDGHATWTTIVRVEDFISAAAKVQFASRHKAKRNGRR